MPPQDNSALDYFKKKILGDLELELMKERDFKNKLKIKKIIKDLQVNAP